MKRDTAYIHKSGKVIWTNVNYLYSDEAAGSFWGSETRGAPYYGRETKLFYESDLIKEIKGEEKMTNEEVKRPEYIIITRNTEVFKKGGVFKYYGSFYAPVDAEQAYTVRPYGDDYIRHELADLLLEKKVAVEAVKFNPEFVTLEQNEVLGKALEGMKTKKAVRKAPAKKTTTKKA